MTPTLIFLVSVLGATLVLGILAIMFSAKQFRPEATLAGVLTVVTIGGWVWRMPQGWYTISQIAWRYGLKTRQVREVAKNLGIMAFNRGALVPPSQRKKMRPELMRLKKQKAVRESSAAKDIRLVYESSDAHSGFLEEADLMQFSGEELLRHLHPSVTDHVAGVQDEAG
ncbi:formate dehydrogenase [Mycobacterium sp. 852002-40037_SCH5390672]|uniref:formate dehydrogenase n=1 Tax=Mycobacterium sp. 852002-40037_SCH5390672 TaxID=1834089 RepID=UPI0008058193|nr:formate dehydrogenase [Mycobacterium sp. 852002-40037_SCH5390672]OBB90711.1 formate dehydrogenase [Mycobacterium sp. 852002-40037_SCH5390672]